MKRYNARQVLIARLAALALSAMCFLQVPVRAQGMAGYIVIFPSVGLAHGQSLRLTLFNPDEGPVRAEARLHHTGGVQVGMGDGSVRFVQPGISCSFDFNRNDIPLAGEPGTGRVQLRATVNCVRTDSSPPINPVVASMEVLEVRDGTSNTIFLAEVIQPISSDGAGNDLLAGGATGDTLIGFVPGQTLRVTLFDPRSSGPAYAPLRVKLFGPNGSLIAQSPELVIPPGTFRSFDFNRDMLRLPGELSTGRLQVRSRVEASTVDPSSSTADPGASGLLAASLELIDNSTGRTTLTCQNNLKQIGIGIHNAY